MAGSYQAPSFSSDMLTESRNVNAGNVFTAKRFALWLPVAKQRLGSPNREAVSNGNLLCVKACIGSDHNRLMMNLKLESF